MRRFLSLVALPLLLLACGGEDPPIAEVDPPALSFQDTPVGSTSVGSITVTNVGESDLVISPTEVTNTVFVATQWPQEITLAAEESFVFEIEFEPYLPEDFEGEFSFRTNDPTAESFEIPLTGTGLPLLVGPQVSITPEALSFPELDVGTIDGRAVSVTNTGDEDLLLSDIAISNHDGESFELAGALPQELTLEPGEGEDLIVRFSPLVPGEHLGSLSFSTNDPDHPTAEIPLTGHASLIPELALAPPQVVFFDQPAGTTDWQVIRVESQSPLTLSIQGVALDDPGAGFSISFPDETTSPIEEDSTTPPTSLDGWEEFLIRVSFTPDDTAPRQTSLTIETDGSYQSTYTVDLVGNPEGGCLEITDLVDFGFAALGETTTQSVVVRNCGTNQDLIVEEIVVEEGSDYFSVEQSLEDLPTSPATIAPGEAAVLSVGFSPSTTETVEGLLTIVSNDAAAPERSIELRGQGVEGSCSTFSVDAPTTAAPTESLSLEVTPDDGTHTFEWALIDSPLGSSAYLTMPVSAATDLFVDLPGHYVVEVTGYDSMGVRSCQPTLVEIEVITEDDIFVALDWTSPTLEALGGPAHGLGIALDLHYAQDGATWGGDDTISRFNTEDDWGDHGAAALILASLYGDLPELLTHNAPQVGGVYRVGVHSYDHDDWGFAQARIQIYLQGQLTAAFSQILPDTGTFWDVATIEWSDSDPTVQLIDELDDDFSLLPF